MTLILAIGCSDGVVLAADSASTDLEVGVKQPANKIQQVGQLPLLYGGSGDVGLLQKIHEGLSSLTFQNNLKRTRQAIKQKVVPELAESAKYHVPYPQRGFQEPPSAILLFAGVQNGLPFILEIERNGGDTFYDEGLGNFAAIGSGKVWAQALFRTHLHSPRDLRLGVVFAYRVLEDAIALAAMGLAPPVHIWTVDTAGSVRHVEDSSLPDTCEMWRELEREAVGRLLAPQAEATVEEVPAPAPELDRAEEVGGQDQPDAGRPPA